MARIGPAAVALVLCCPAGGPSAPPSSRKPPLNEPSLTVAGESIDCAAYLQRQGFFRDVLRLVRLRRFRDPFITDRALVDAFVNEGSVVGVTGDRVAVTFVPPFVGRGETVQVVLSDRPGDVVPIVLGSPGGLAGVSLSERLSGATAAKIRPGMVVRRK